MLNSLLLLLSFADETNQPAKPAQKEFPAATRIEIMDAQLRLEAAKAAYFQAVISANEVMRAALAAAQASDCQIGEKAVLICPEKPEKPDAAKNK